MNAHEYSPGGGIRKLKREILISIKYSNII